MLGKIDYVHNNWVYIENFAPGIWVGTEGAIIIINNNKYLIKNIDFEKKALELYGDYISGLTKCYIERFKGAYEV